MLLGMLLATLHTTEQVLQPEQRFRSMTIPYLMGFLLLLFLRLRHHAVPRLNFHEAIVVGRRWGRVQSTICLLVRSLLQPLMYWERCQPRSISRQPGRIPALKVALATAWPRS